MSVLLLNASYEPLSIISYRRAIGLLLRERVEAATMESEVLHAGQQALYVPVVLRLRRYVHVPRRGARWSRAGVLRRDAYRCIYCGIQAGETRAGHTLHRADFSVDHLIPRSRGGKNGWGNTACACYACNQRKGDRTPHEAGMTLLWEPKTPRVDYLVLYGEVPEAWKVYLRTNVH
ncbi:MAG: HNH endonuclease [Caldilineales bacterium]|nr:HNH endonuclease [Caldilineales bacterium]